MDAKSDIIRQASLVALPLLCVLCYAWLFEPNRLNIQRLVIKDPILTQAWPGLTIVHLSDTHNHP